MEGEGDGDPGRKNLPSLLKQETAVLHSLRIFDTLLARHFDPYVDGYIFQSWLL